MCLPARGILPEPRSCTAPGGVEGVTFAPSADEGLLNDIVGVLVRSEPSGKSSHHRKVWPSPCRELGGARRRRPALLLEHDLAPFIPVYATRS